MATKSDKLDKAAQVAQEIETYNPALHSWADLRAESDEVLGYDLAKDALLDALERIPFMVTRVQSRPGAVHRDTSGADKQYAYFSLECRIAPEEDLLRRRIDLATMPFRPDDHVVFNDGSTGIKRQVMAYLQAKGFIELPDGSVGGKFGESIYDLPPGDWSDVKVGELIFDENGFANYSANLRLFVPRGLRISTYNSDFNPDGGKTRYFA